MPTRRRVVDVCSLLSPTWSICIWLALFRKDIRELAKLQRRAAKLIKGKARLPSEDRLKTLWLSCLEGQRQANWGVIEALKSLSHIR